MSVVVLMAYGAGSIWIANGLDLEKPSRDKLSVSRLDPETNKEAARIYTGLNMWSLAVSGGSVWATGSPPDCTSSDEGALIRIDPATNKVIGRTNVRCAYSVAATNDAVWVHSVIEPGAGGAPTGAVTRVEPARRAANRRGSGPPQFKVAEPSYVTGGLCAPCRAGRYS